MRFDLKDLWRDKFVRGTFFLTAVTFFSSAFNYLVHPILTRHLTIAEYGDFQALLSFVTIIGILSTVMLTALTKEFSILASTAPEEIVALRRRALCVLSVAGLAVFAATVIFSGAISRLFHISGEWTLIFASLCFSYALPLAVNQALITGKQRFSALSFNNFLGALGRLVFVFLLVVVWPLRIVGASLALGFGGLIAFAASFFQSKRIRLPDVARDFSGSFRSIGSYVLLVLWFTAISQFFYNFDILFVKSFFNPEEAGLYGALLTVGRIIYFVGGAVPLVLFPVIANLKKVDGLRRYAVLGKSLALMAALSLPVYFVMFFWPEFLIRIIVGVKYLSIAPYLPGFGLVMLALTLVSVLSSYFLALARRRSLIIMTGAVFLELVLLGLFHDGLAQVIVSLGISFTAAAAGLLCLVLFEYRQTRGLLYAQKD